MKKYRRLNNEVRAMRFMPADWEHGEPSFYCEGYVKVNKSQEYGEPGRWFTAEKIPAMIMPGDWVIIEQTNGDPEYINIAAHETFLNEYREINK